MTSFVSSVLLTVFLVMLLVIIRNLKGEMAVSISLCVSVLLVGLSLAVFGPIFDFLNTLVIPGSENRVNLLLKAVGVSLVASTASDVCRDCGETAIASKVELFGKCEILLLSLPLLKEITELVTLILQE